ncbi:M23 family metallopeptidase [Deinococcus pimensis]|uniref:M23 family metallopeptidase n=1 Tax=Deinococcus pimensis TaxID=309888 RepID=UPI000486577F|nr:M23 family metallopeptidase [Deinococcus pimensis]
MISKSRARHAGALVLSALLALPACAAPVVSYPESAAARAFLAAVAGSAGYRVTQGFGAHPSHADPETGGTVDVYGYGVSGHNGWDVALGQPGRDGAKGAAIHAPFTGKVFRGEQRDAKGNFSGLGRWVKLVASSGASVTFGHLGGYVGPASGQKAQAGAALGYEGTTGNSTGYHVHVMIRDAAGRIVDPGGLTGVAALGPGTATASAAPGRKDSTTVPVGPDPAAVRAARQAAWQAEADLQTARELYAVGAVARVEVQNRSADLTSARAVLARVQAGEAPAGKAVLDPKVALAAAERAYREASALYAVGGVSRAELDRRGRALSSARAAAR